MHKITYRKRRVAVSAAVIGAVLGFWLLFVIVQVIGSLL